MKEWSNKPATDLVKTSSSPVRTVSSSPIGSTGSSIVKTSGSIVKTSGASMTLTGGSSTTLVSTSSPAVSSSLTQRAAVGAATIGPLAAGTVVGGIAVLFYGVSNMIQYGEHKKAGAQAAKDTVKDSVGLGVSAGLGVAAAHAVAGTTLALGSTLVVPLTAGVATVYIGKKIWDKIFSRGKEASKAESKTK